MTAITRRGLRPPYAKPVSARVTLAVVAVAALLGGACAGGGAEAGQPTTLAARAVTGTTIPTMQPAPATPTPPPPIDLEALRLRNLFRDWPMTDPSTLTVDPGGIHSGGVGRDRIIALDAESAVEIESPFGQAEFAPAAEVDYPDGLPIAYVTVAGHTRGYPLSIMSNHEIVNDEIEGVPLLATYCPLCNTAIAFERRLDGQRLDFGVSGFLRNSDLIMFDRQTESWWQQVSGEAIAGSFAGRTLTPIPMAVISYRDFVASFPDADILTPNTGFQFEYGLNQYASYDTSRPFLFHGELDRLAALERVVGLDFDGEVLAVPFTPLAETGVANVTVGEQRVVVLWSPGTISVLDAAVITESRDVGAAVAYDATIDGEALTFEALGGGEFRDTGTGSTWNGAGLAIEGPLAGRRLAVVEHGNHLWFAWAAFYPETAIWSAP